MSNCRRRKGRFEHARIRVLPGRDRLWPVTTQAIVEHHKRAAEHHRLAAENHELAAKHYTHGDHDKAAHFALLAHAHMQHAGAFMSDAAKIHAELHGGNRHTLIG